MGWFARIVCLFWGVLLTARANYQNGKNNVPRLKLSYKEMLESNNVITFNGLANSSSYHTFLLDEERSRLYVGDHIFSFNLVNIKDFQKIVWPVSYTRRDECKWAGKDILKECANFIKVLKAYNQTHLYACGTGAFHPVCTYIEIGHHPEVKLTFKKWSCNPFIIKLMSYSLSLENGELYSGTAADFMGRDFAIFRTLGHHHPIRTEQHDSRWLNGRCYYLQEHKHKTWPTHARIGQICKVSLVNKWTTFLKARLICSVPGPNGIDTHFDELQDVFLMNSKDPKNPVVYGVFTTSSNIFKGMSDVRRVFLGPYAHRDGPNYQWVPYQGRVPYPRPGTVSDLDAVYSHWPLSSSNPRHTPAQKNWTELIIKPDLSLQFKVGRKKEKNQYDVGTVLKVVSIPKETWHDLEEVLLEEMTVFREPTSISAMELSTKQQQLYIGSTTGVTQLPLHRCDIYGKACAECCLARDPYCAWDGSSCSRYFPTAKRRTRRQDIRNGDPLTHCSDLQHHDNHHGHSFEERIIYGVENSSTFLECSPKSQRRALVYWQFQRRNEERKEEIRVDDHIIRTEQGLLLRSLQRKDSGNYLCHAAEHGFVQTLLKVTLEVIDTEHLEELLHKDDDGDGSKTKETSNSMTPSQKVWYRDFMQLINHPNLNTMDEFCEQVWKRDRKQRRQRPGHTQGNSNKWKHLQENKKGRNRRTHEFERAPRSV
uniref:Semaphorin 3A n=1 Tax=Capra hircus TaxID=9925 RepID=A0A8C2RV36_CAPHI